MKNGEIMASRYPVEFWYVAAHSAELGTRPVARRLLEERLVLFRTEGGAPVALQDRCIHRLLPLSRGCVIGERLQCGYHGAEFDRDGRCVAVPGQSEIPPQAQVKSYPVQERHGFVWVWMGEPAMAPAVPQQPMFDYLEDPDWNVLDGYLPIACNYLLVNDNLADISHTEFVHASTLGSRYVRATRNDGMPVEQQGQVTFESELVDGGMDFRFRASRTPIAPTFENGFARVRGRDGWTALDFQLDFLFRPPGCWIFRPTTMPQDGRLEDGVRVDGIIAITPETATTCHYFHKTCQRYAPRNGAETAYWHEQFGKAFVEDKDVLEAQQGSIGDVDLLDHPHVSFRGDRLGFMVRRMVSGLAGGGVELG
jgi:vanillate O-demethylase monooxygenase subunit